jgi:hypothetical protein
MGEKGPVLLVTDDPDRASINTLGHHQRQQLATYILVGTREGYIVSQTDRHTRNFKLLISLVREKTRLFSV